MSMNMLMRSSWTFTMEVLSSSHTKPISGGSLLGVEAAAGSCWLACPAFPDDAAQCATLILPVWMEPEMPAIPISAPAHLVR